MCFGLRRHVRSHTLYLFTSGRLCSKRSLVLTLLRQVTTGCKRVSHTGSFNPLQGYISVFRSTTDLAPAPNPPPHHPPLTTPCAIPLNRTHPRAPPSRRLRSETLARVSEAPCRGDLNQIRTESGPSCTAQCSPVCVSHSQRPRAGRAFDAWAMTPLPPPPLPPPNAPSTEPSSKRARPRARAQASAQRSGGLRLWNSRSLRAANPSSPRRSRKIAT